MANPWVRFLLYCAIALSLSAWFTKAVHAQESVLVFAKEPIAISVTVPSDQHYALKLRFRTSTNSYRGDTWVNGTWLGTQTAWDRFPEQAGHIILIGEIDDLTDVVALQIAGRKSGSDVTEVLQEIPIQTAPVAVTVKLKAYLPDHKTNAREGFIHVQELGSERSTPILSDTVSLSFATRQSVIALVGPNGEAWSVPQPYRFSAGTYFTLSINAPEATHYDGGIDQVGTTRPYENATVHLSLSPVYDEGITWYTDGIKTQEGGLSLSHVFSTAGDKEVVAVLANGQRFTTRIPVRSYDHISLMALLPNPTGSDSKAEAVTLKNDNAFPVTLSHWLLKSRNSTTQIPITASLPAHEATSITLSSQLRNSDGAYDFINESGDVVDSVTYASAPEGVHLVRSGLLWQADPKDVAQKTAETANPTVNFEGIIDVPRGRTFTLMTAQGLIRVVLHPSYTNAKPKLHHNDRIRVSGIWKVSRLGRYLSVRAGHELTVLQVASSVKKTPKHGLKKSRKKTAKSAKKFSAPFSSQVAHAASGEGLASSTSKTLPLQLAFLPPLWLALLFPVMITGGVALLLPSLKPRGMA